MYPRFRSSHCEVYWTMVGWGGGGRNFLYYQICGERACESKPRNLSLLSPPQSWELSCICRVTKQINKPPYVRVQVFAKKKSCENYQCISLSKIKAFFSFFFFSTGFSTVTATVTFPQRSYVMWWLLSGRCSVMKKPKNWLPCLTKITMVSWSMKSL